MTNTVLRRAWTGQFSTKSCAHLDIVPAEPRDDECRECVASGDIYPAMRACMTCGHVGCCDKAKNRHALKHHQATGHPLIRPHLEPVMDWIWCYVDGALLEPDAVRSNR